MKATGNPNINTRSYWNGIYADTKKRMEYAAQGTSLNNVGGNWIAPTKRFETALSHIKPGDRVLDIGCGVGVFTSLVKATYPSCDVWGTDISNKAIADNCIQQPDIKYLCCKVGSQEGVPENYFDVVFSGEVLEHLDEPALLVKDAYRALKSGGKFVLTTPNVDGVISDEHVWFFTPDDVSDLMHGAGFDRVVFTDLPDLEYSYVIFAVGEKK